MAISHPEQLSLDKAPSPLKPRNSRRAFLAGVGVAGATGLAAYLGLGRRGGNDAITTTPPQPTAIPTETNVKQPILAATTKPDASPTPSRDQEGLEAGWVRHTSRHNPYSIAIPKDFTIEDQWTTGQKLDAYRGETVNGTQNVIYVTAGDIEPWRKLEEYAKDYKQRLKTTVAGTYNTAYKGSRPPDHSLVQGDEDGEVFIDGRPAVILITSRMPQITTSGSTLGHHYMRVGLVRLSDRKVLEVTIDGIEESRQKQFDISYKVFESIRILSPVGNK